MQWVGGIGQKRQKRVTLASNATVLPSDATDFRIFAWFLVKGGIGIEDFSGGQGCQA
jgi:hypothetical protein